MCERSPVFKTPRPESPSTGKHRSPAVQTTSGKRFNPCCGGSTGWKFTGNAPMSDPRNDRIFKLILHNRPVAPIHLLNTFLPLKAPIERGESTCRRSCRLTSADSTRPSSTSAVGTAFHSGDAVSEEKESAHRACLRADLIRAYRYVRRTKDGNPSLPAYPHRTQRLVPKFGRKNGRNHKYFPPRPKSAVRIKNLLGFGGFNIIG